MVEIKIPLFVKRDLNLFRTVAFCPWGIALFRVVENISQFFDFVLVVAFSEQKKNLSCTLERLLFRVGNADFKTADECNLFVFDC